MRDRMTLRGRRSTAVLLALATLLVGAGKVWAQAAPATQADSDSALPEVTVTATRREESLSKVPISVTALTEQSLDERGIKDMLDVARFTPGVSVDNSGTNNVSIRGISSTGGAGTTGIYIDDTPIQMRALAFNPDETLPKSFDIERIEVLRGPQGTLFGSGSEGGTVRYITVQPSLTRTSYYARTEVSGTEGGDPSYEAGVAVGGPLVEGKFGARLSVWYRNDGGWIDRIDPVTLATVDTNANHAQTMLIRLAGLWAVNDQWTVTPAIYYQDRKQHDISVYWPLYSDPASNQFVNADPTRRAVPDRFYLPSLKIEGDFSGFSLISNTSYYHRREQSGYEGTLYNLGFYQAQPTTPGASPVFPLPWLAPFPLLDGNGIHLPPGATDYVSPSTVDNGQENITQEIRVQSSDPGARLVWTAGAFFSSNRQDYLEQIHDPHLNELSMALLGVPYTDIFTYTDPVTGITSPVLYDPRFPDDAYFLQTHAKDQQYAVFGEATYAITPQLKATLGARYSWTKYSFDTLTGGPQLYSPPRTGSGENKENAFTPKVSLAYEFDRNNMLYATYAKGFRPGGANNPVPYAACAADFANFGISGAPTTYSSDSVESYEIGAKDSLFNRIRLASSIYYIRWNNIQQTVVPPICQITFIANLGQAVAKGADIQADIAVTDHFTAEIAAGYTDARYTQDSRFTPTETQPIVADGDAIVGQSSEGGGGRPTTPFTASIGLQYNFVAFAKDSFVRLDAEYESRAKWLPASQDPNTLQYDSANFTLDATTFVSLRAGMSFERWNISAFIDNLTDTHALTDYTFTIDPGTGDSRLRRDFTFRPRTIGITAIFHN
jgi:outer membrane receptor protein involved in Fe transport